MMQESSGQNKGYHRPDGATNPLHSDFGLFGIKKDYTGRQPGYGVKPLAGDSPEEQARFAADYLAAMVKQSGGIEGGLAGYHTGNPGGLDTEEGRNYVGMVKGQKVPISGFKDDTGNMGRFGYRGYGPLIDKRDSSFITPADAAMLKALKKHSASEGFRRNTSLIGTRSSIRPCPMASAASTSVASI